MKKFTLFFAVALLAFGINAQETNFNNPNGSDGKMTFLWDCEKNDFATDRPSNDFEIDQTIVLAIDVTGMPVENWIREGGADGITRSLAFSMWNDNGGNADVRLIHIRGNIYGITINFYQFLNDNNANLNFSKLLTGSLEADAVTYFWANVFGFGYTSTEWGEEWWDDSTPSAPPVVMALETSPYTGNKKSNEFYNDDFDVVVFPESAKTFMGYAAPCVMDNPGSYINEVNSDSPIIKTEYFDVFGHKLSETGTGIYIEKVLRADGTSTSTKVYKQINK